MASMVSGKLEAYPCVSLIQTSVAGTIAGSGVGEGEGDGDGVEVSRITGSAVGVTAGAGAEPD